MFLGVLYFWVEGKKISLRAAETLEKGKAIGKATDLGEPLFEKETSSFWVSAENRETVFEENTIF